MMLKIKKHLEPYSQFGLISKYLSSNATIYDFGCGNMSPQKFKTMLPNCYYIGFDITEYNLCEEDYLCADELIISDYPLKELNTCSKFPDLINCSHVLEHLINPGNYVKEFLKKHPTHIYFSFPCQDSINFPPRSGTLNFYDDPTHLTVIDPKEIINLLTSNNYEIVFYREKYKPYFRKSIGYFQEKFKINTTIANRYTWAYFGFESVIFAKIKNHASPNNK